MKYASAPSRLQNTSGLKRYRTPRSIAAIQIQPGPSGGPELNAITHLAAGCEISACGPGFNARTIKVEWQGSYFYVFTEDLEAKP